MGDTAVMSTLNPMAPETLERHCSVGVQQENATVLGTMDVGKSLVEVRGLAEGRGCYDRPPPVHTPANWSLLLRLPQIDAWLRSIAMRIRDLASFVQHDTGNRHGDAHLVLLKDICEDMAGHVEQVRGLLEAEFPLRLLAISVELLLDIRAVQLLWHRLRVATLVLRERIFRGLQDANGNVPGITPNSPKSNPVIVQTEECSSLQTDKNGLCDILTRCSVDYFSLDCGISASELKAVSPWAETSSLQPCPPSSSGEVISEIGIKCVSTLICDGKQSQRREQIQNLLDEGETKNVSPLKESSSKDTDKLEKNIGDDEETKFETSEETLPHLMRDGVESTHRQSLTLEDGDDTVETMEHNMDEFDKTRVMQDEFNVDAPERTHFLDSSDIKAEGIYCREAVALMASSALEKPSNFSTQAVDSNIRPDCRRDALKSKTFDRTTKKLTAEPQTSQSDSTNLLLQRKKIKEPIYQDGGDACVIVKGVQGIASCLETDNKAVLIADVIPSEADTVTITGAENISLAKKEFQSPDSRSSDSVNAHQQVDNSLQFQNVKCERSNPESTQQYPATHLEGSENQADSLTVVKTIKMENDFRAPQLNFPNEPKKVDENGREDVHDVCHLQVSSPTCDEDKPNLRGYSLHPKPSEIQSTIPFVSPSTKTSDGDILEASRNRTEKPDERWCLSLYNKLGYEDDGCRAEVQAVMAENSILFEINETGLDDWEISEASEILGQRDDSSEGQPGYSPVRDLLERDHIDLPNNRLFASNSMDLEHGLVLTPERSSDIAPEGDGSSSPASSEGESDGEQEKLELLSWRLQELLAWLDIAKTWARSAHCPATPEPHFKKSFRDTVAGRELLKDLLTEEGQKLIVLPTKKNAELQEALRNVRDQWENLRQLMNSNVAADAAEQIEMSTSHLVLPKEAPASEVTIQVAVEQESLTLPTSESLSRKVGKLRTWLRDADLLSLRACLADHSKLEQDLKAQISKLEILRTEISQQRKGVAALLRLIGHLHGAPGLLGLAERASQSLQRSWEAIVLQAAFWEHQLRRWHADRNGAAYSLKIQTLTDEYLEWDETDFGQAFEMTFRDKSKITDDEALSSASDLDIPSPSAGRELCAILQLSTPVSPPLPGLWLMEEENLEKDVSRSEGLSLHLKKFEDEVIHEEARCNSNSDVFSKPEKDLQSQDSGALSPRSECTASHSMCSSSEIAFMEDEAHCLSSSQSAIASQRVDSGVAQDYCHGDLSRATLQLIRQLEQASDGERGCNDEKDEVNAQNSLSDDSSWYEDSKCNGGEELACSIAVSVPKKGGIPTSCSLIEDVSISMIVNISAASILSEEDEEHGERVRERAATMAALEEDATDVDTGSDSLSIDDPDLDGSISSESESWDDDDDDEDDDDDDDEEEESGGSGFEFDTGHRWDHQCKGHLLSSHAARGTSCSTCSPAKTSWADDMENGNVLDTTDSEMTQKCECSEREQQIALTDRPQTYTGEYSSSSSSVGGESALMQERDEIRTSQVLESLYNDVGKHSSSNKLKFTPQSTLRCKTNLAACDESATSETMNNQRTVGYFGELEASTLGLYCALSSGDGSSCDDLSTTPLLGWEEEGRCEELSTAAPNNQPTDEIMENDKDKELNNTSTSSITICHVVVREGGTASKTGLSQRKPPPPPHPRLPPPTPPRPNMTVILERHAKRREVSLAKEMPRPIDHGPQPSRATLTPEVVSGTKTGRSYLPRPVNTSRLTSRPTMDIEVCSALLSTRPSKPLAERSQLHPTRKQDALPCPEPRQQSVMRKPTMKKPSFLPA